MNRLKNFRWAGLLSAGTVMLALFLSLFAIPTEVSAQTAPPTMTVNIQGFAFAPATITIPVGTKVIWTNKDTAAHTVTSDSGGVLNSPLIPQNGTFEFTFTTAGTFSYHCTPHPNMKANIVVTAATAASTPAQVPATGIGGLNNPESQGQLLWLIPLTALSLITLLALAVRRRTHR